MPNICLLILHSNCLTQPASFCPTVLSCSTHRQATSLHYSFASFNLRCLELQSYPNQPKDHPVAQQYTNITTVLPLCLKLQANISELIYQITEPICSTSLPKDTMTVALVSQQATMPGFKNSADLDEVHSLSRYCFLYTQFPGRLRILHFQISHVVAQIMYACSCFIVFPNGHRSKNPQEPLQNLPWTFLRIKGPDLSIPGLSFDLSYKLDSFTYGSVRTRT